MKDRFAIRTLVDGNAEGPAVVSTRAFTFAHGVDPSTGRVTDVHSDIVGESVKGKVLIYPYGKGSTTASAWFLETVRAGNGPVAVVTGAVDLAAVIGSVLAGLLYGKKIPVATVLQEGLFARSGGLGRASIDGEKGEVRVD